MTVEHRLLGPVETWVDGPPLDLGYAQQRCVFAVLLAELNQVLPARVLIARVWGDGPPASTLAALYAHIARLRRTLAGDAGVPVTLAGMARHWSAWNRTVNEHHRPEGSAGRAQQARSPVGGCAGDLGHVLE